jgi:hypothetical protein
VVLETTHRAFFRIAFIDLWVISMQHPCYKQKKKLHGI